MKYVKIAINKMNGHGFYLLTAAEQTLVLYDTYANQGPIGNTKIYNGIRTEKVDLFIIFYIY